MATKKSVVTAVRPWDERLAEYAQAAAKGEESGGASALSFKGGILNYNGAAVPGNKLNVIVVGALKENAYYDERYDSDNPQPPVCYAFGVSEEDEMAPHEESAKPQHATCEGCPQNEWGSSDTGRGKACKNIRRLALITEEGLEEPSTAEVVIAKLPVTSVKAWAGYVQQVAATLRRPPFAVITEISCVSDPKTQFKVIFKFVEEIKDSEKLESLLTLHGAAKARLNVPYPQPEEKPVAPAKAGKFRR